MFCAACGQRAAMVGGEREVRARRKTVQREKVGGARRQKRIVQSDLSGCGMPATRKFVFSVVVLDETRACRRYVGMNIT